MLGLQCFVVEFLAYHLVVSQISTLATEQIVAAQVFLMELMVVILWQIPSILNEFLDLSYTLIAIKIKFGGSYTLLVFIESSKSH